MGRKRSRKGRPVHPVARVLEGRVRSVAAGGEAVVETEHGVVLAPFGLPGEQVRLRGVERAGGALRGRIEAVLQPSAERVQAPCPLVDRCGGCPLMRMDLAAQRRLKEGLVQRALEGAPQRGAVRVRMELAADGGGLRYRRRARLHWQRRADGLVLGYRRRRSRTLVDVEDCAVLSPELQRALTHARAKLGPVLTGCGELLVARGAGGAAAVALRSDDAQPPPVFRAAEALAAEPEVAGVSLRAAGASADACWGDPHEYLRAADGGWLRAPVGGFSQANDAVNARLVQRVVELAELQRSPPTRVLELYAGSGNITVALAARGAAVVAVESDPQAAQCARDNLGRRDLEAEVVTADAAAAPPKGGAAVVVLDPPRTGAREAIEVICAPRPTRIVYVSCDPATLGRDLVELGRRGFAVDAAHAFDMFPQTAHVEALVRLRRAA